MEKYHKIQTVFLRDPETKYKTLLDGQFAKPEFEYLQNNKWIFTEKVDGTNIRVIWDGENVTFKGRTDKAEIPPFLLDKLSELFPIEKFKKHYLPAMCLYGEGYGAKIQKGGGDYISNDVGFILFDCFQSRWVSRSVLQLIAYKFEIEVVPVVGYGVLSKAVAMAQDGFNSKLRNTPPEGLIMKPEIEMLNQYGERIVTKIKLKDFA